MARSQRGGGFNATYIALGDSVNGHCNIVPFTGTIDTSNTFKGTDKSLPGTLLIDLTGLKLYINTGTQASPTWTIVGTQS
jgi:hypothetical protein